MLYFSQILNTAVRDQADVKAGRLIDLAIKKDSTQEYPQVVGIILQTKDKREKKFVKVVDIENFAKDNIILKKSLKEVVRPFSTEHNLILLGKMVLDKQIVDLDGIRVVRVNDLQFGFIKNIMSLVAIDIGLGGLMRRLGLGRLSYLAKPKLVEWKNVSLVGHKIQLPTEAVNLVKLHPADIANLVEKLNLNQGSALLDSMDESTIARVLEEVEPEVQKILVSKWGPERAALVMQKMSIDELADLIQLLPSRESREILGKLSVSGDTRIQKVKQILEYNEDTAGGLMTTEYVAVNPLDTIEKTVAHIKHISHMHHSIYFVYVVEKDGKLLGVVSLRRLLTADKKQTIREIMKKTKRLPVAKVSDELLSVASKMTKYNLFSLAVVEKKGGKLLGVITADDIMRHFLPHA